MSDTSGGHPMDAEIDRCADEIDERTAIARDRTLDGLGRARSALERAAESAARGQSTTGEEGMLDRVLHGHVGLLSTYRAQVRARAERQAELARKAADHTRAIGEAAVKMGRAAHSSHLVAMNALIASARLGRSGAALAVLANEMQDLSQTVHSTSRSVRTLADRLVELLPGIEKTVGEAQKRTETFAVEVDAESHTVQDAAAGLQEVLRRLQQEREHVAREAYRLAEEGLDALSWGDAFSDLLDDLEGVSKRVRALSQEASADDADSDDTTMVAA